MELVEVTGVASVPLKWEETLLMPIGDVQLGPNCDTERFRKHIQWGIDHNAYFLGMCDYVDCASPSNRKQLRSASLYDSVVSNLELGAEKDVSDFLELVKGTEGRWLGLLEGHHFYEFLDGTTTDTRLAQALKTPFLGTCAFVRLRYTRPSSNESLTATIWCHHGAGGGTKAGSPLTKIENLLPYFDADIYLIGHQHKKVSAPIDQLYMTHKKPYMLNHKTKILACTGSFLRGYNQGSRTNRAQGTYVEKAMMNPVALGGILVKIRPTRDNQRHAPSRLDLGIEL